MHLVQVDKRDGLTRESFKAEYLDPLKPVVFKDLIKDWPAKDKWTFNYLKQKYGHLTIPIYDATYSMPGKTYMNSNGKMLLGDYLDLIQEKPTELRIFLFNVIKNAPDLVNDIQIPSIMDGFYNEFPFMFFGGQGSCTKIHYDIDCSHVFLNQFQVKKKVILFHPDQSQYLYQIPFTVSSLVDFTNPDESKFPKLKKIQGYETILEHGETLFIPSQYWHYIEYTQGGYSLSLRANNSLSMKMKGVLKIVEHYAVDKGMNMLLGQKWLDWKRTAAYKK